MDNDFNKPSSKEELARQIARNMAMQNGRDVFSDNTEFFSDENNQEDDFKAEERRYVSSGSADGRAKGRTEASAASAGVKTAEKPHKNASRSGDINNGASSKRKKELRQRKSPK